MKYCNKDGCLNISIKRGKYCEEHRTNKRKSRSSPINIPQSDISSSMIIEEQEIEFQETQLKDLLIMEEKERKEFEMSSLREKVFNSDKTDECFTIKFSLNNGNKISYFFSNKAKVSDLFDFIDIYFYDNKINCKNYYFVLFPNIKILRNEIENYISDTLKSKQILLFIQDIDV